MTTAIDIQTHLLELQAERAHATIEGIAVTPSTWLTSTGIEATARAYVGAAVTEIATLRAELSGPHFSTTYIGEPNTPAALTISEYRCCRPRLLLWWRRILQRPGR